MSNSNGIITRPVLLTPSGGDLGQVLGVVYNNVKDYIDNAPINPFAKYKPVRYATLDDTGESATEQPNYWKATDGQCGFSIPTSTNTSSSPAFSSSAWYKLLNAQMMWSYNRPNGTLSTQPYRQNDFDGYYHGAPRPIVGTADSIMLGQDGSLTVPIESNRGNARSIQLSDLSINGTSLNNWYIGALVYVSNSQYTFKTGGRIGDGDTDVVFTGMTAYAGRTVKIVPFLASGQLAQGTGASNITVISGDVAAQDVAIRAYSTGIRVDLSAQWADSFHVRCEYACNLINDSATSKTVTNMVITLYRDNTALATKTVASQTIPAGGSNLTSGILLNNDTYDQSARYHVTVVSDGSMATGDTDVEEFRT